MNWRTILTALLGSVFLLFAAFFLCRDPENNAIAPDAQPPDATTRSSVPSDYSNGIVSLDSYDVSSSPVLGEEVLAPVAHQNRIIPLHVYERAKGSDTTAERSTFSTSPKR